MWVACAVATASTIVTVKTVIAATKYRSARNFAGTVTARSIHRLIRRTRSFKVFLNGGIRSVADSPVAACLDTGLSPSNLLLLGDGPGWWDGHSLQAHYVFEISGSLSPMVGQKDRVRFVVFGDGSLVVGLCCQTLPSLNCCLFPRLLTLTPRTPRLDQQNGTGCHSAR